MERGRDDLAHGADPFHRRQRLQKLVRRRRVHGRVDDAGRDRIHANALRRKLERERACRVVDTAFDEDGKERRNGGLRQARQARGDVDDRARAALGHVPGGLLTRIDEALQVRADHLLDVVDVVVGGRLGDEDARVVDEHIHVAEPIERGFEQALADFGPADVAVDRYEAFRRSERVGCLLQA